MAEFAQREAAGENPWTTTFSEPARIRLEVVVEQWFARFPEAAGTEMGRRVDNLLRRFGFRLKVSNRAYRTAVLTAVRGETDDFLPSVLEAVMAVAELPDLEFEVKRTLEDERLAYRLVNRQLIPFDSLELHEEVVAPTLRLLAGRPDLTNVEEGYQSALKEIGANPADAITDAARALQAMLTAIGCEGNSIGAQLTFARKNRIFANHDATLGGGIEKIIHWVNADRSEKGDAHQSAKVTTDDAWFAVHVVGALIVRLSEGPRV